MSKPLDPDDIDSAGDKIIVGSCPDCQTRGFDHSFSFRVSRLTSQVDFLRYARCPNCGRRGLIFEMEYEV